MFVAEGSGGRAAGLCTLIKPVARGYGFDTRCFLQIRIVWIIISACLIKQSTILGEIMACFIMTGEIMGGEK